MNSTHGARLRASMKASWSWRSLTPYIGSSTSSIRRLRNGTPHSPAVARASSVLPQPGGP